MQNARLRAEHNLRKSSLKLCLERSSDQVVSEIDILNRRIPLGGLPTLPRRSHRLNSPQFSSQDDFRMILRTGRLTAAQNSKSAATNDQLTCPHQTAANDEAQSGDRVGQCMDRSTHRSMA